MKKIILVLIFILQYAICNSMNFKKEGVGTKNSRFYHNQSDSIIIVTAKSGLSVRNAPSLNARRIGKLPYLTSVEVLQKTNKMLEIEDEGKTVSGYWVAIKYKNKRAYVFDAFISEKEKYFSKIKAQQFIVSKVTKATTFLKTITSKKAIEFKTGKQIYFIPKETKEVNLIPTTNNSFIQTVEDAYDMHRPLILSPDIIWLTISQGFSIHLNKNFKKLAPKVFKKKKPKEIKFRVDGLEDGPEKWAQLITLLSNETRKFTNKDIYKTLVPKFSTTTPIITSSYEITLLESFKQAFQYITETGCGIPYITLKGNVLDWEYLYKNVQGLKGYGLDDWIEELLPVLNQFIESSKGNVDKVFWNNIYKNASEYNAFYISGWIVKFFPYLKVRGEETGVYSEKFQGDQVKEEYMLNPYFKESDYLLSTLSTDDFPSGIAQIDITWNDLLEDKKTPIEVYAGFMGTKQYKDKSLEPYISYAICKKNAPKIENNYPKANANSSIHKEYRYWSPTEMEAGNLYKKAIYDLKKHKTYASSLSFLKSYLSEIEYLKGSKVSFTVLTNGKITNVLVNNKSSNKYTIKVKEKLKGLPQKWFPAIAEVGKALDYDFESELEAKKHIRVNSKVVIQL